MKTDIPLLAAQGQCCRGVLKDLPGAIDPTKIIQWAVAPQKGRATRCVAVRCRSYRTYRSARRTTTRCVVRGL